MSKPHKSLKGTIDGTNFTEFCELNWLRIIAWKVNQLNFELTRYEKRQCAHNGKKTNPNHCVSSVLNLLVQDDLSFSLYQVHFIQILREIRVCSYYICWKFWFLCMIFNKLKLENYNSWVTLKSYFQITVICWIEIDGTNTYI